MIVKNCSSARKKTWSILFLLPLWEDGAIHQSPSPTAWLLTATVIHSHTQSPSFCSKCSFHNTTTKLIHNDTDRCFCSSCSMDKEIRAVLTASTNVTFFCGDTDHKRQPKSHSKKSNNSKGWFQRMQVREEMAQHILLNFSKWKKKLSPPLILLFIRNQCRPYVLQLSGLETATWHQSTAPN